MIEYNNGLPVYWRDETSGKMARAVQAYWQPYSKDKAPPELEEKNINLNLMR